METIRDEAAKLDRLLRRTEAAKYITATYGFPCSPKTLAKLACVSSEGPPFRLAGRFPLYPVPGLDAWAQSKIGPLVQSTSQAQSVARTKTPTGPESDLRDQGADLDTETV
jgi:hypothetical protein